MKLLPNLLLLEAICYAVAALVHAGILLRGYEDRAALIAESLIALLLGSAWLIVRVRPRLVKAIALASQGIALFWTMVGTMMVVLGLGPSTLPDFSYHVAIVSLLIYGLTVARRLPSS